MKRILVTGGAGYIGSVTVKKLISEGYDVVVFDNLQQGNPKAVTCKLVVGDLIDRDCLNKSLEGTFDAVIHFAAYALAAESMHDPYKYFMSNILGGLNLFEFMRKKNVKNIVFSSTCAVYGTPKILPVNEKADKNPESVYGESKLMLEKILQWYEKIYGLKHINLRYFNAAGAALDSSLGENHNPETHIIPLAIQVALGEKPYFELYGNNYPTKDGTCIRDYIHVEDLADAHILALKKLEESHKSDSFNLGTGEGYSNQEVLKMVKEISGINFSIKILPPRPGDPPIIFSDNKKALDFLGFNPNHSDLRTIIKSAWEWHKKIKFQNGR